MATQRSSSFGPRAKQQSTHASGGGAGDEQECPRVGLLSECVWAGRFEKLLFVTLTEFVRWAGDSSFS